MTAQTTRALTRRPVTHSAVFEVAQQALKELQLSDRLFLQTVGFEGCRWRAVVRDRDTGDAYKTSIPWTDDDIASNVEHFKVQMTLVLPRDGSSRGLSNYQQTRAR